MTNPEAVKYVCIIQLLNNASCPNKKQTNIFKTSPFSVRENNQ